MICLWMTSLPRPRAAGELEAVVEGRREVVEEEVVVEPGVEEDSEAAVVALVGIVTKYLEIEDIEFIEDNAVI